jgi:riboflavin kinase/FMN adenylyltransferase
MKIIRGIHNLKEFTSNTVVTIGNFDGIHLGHEKLLFHTYQIGIKKNIPSVIIIFEPQPLEFLHITQAPMRITKFREKIKRIVSYQIDYVLCIKFNKVFQSINAEEFIINILINKLHTKYIVIGDDFRFGYKKHGNIQLLYQLGKKYFFNVIKIKSLYKNNIKISSTNIRTALLENNIELCSQLLGRSFSIIGRVVHGNSIGNKIGYPTANIVLNKNFLLSNGVYAVKVYYLPNKVIFGICNIGIKPSFFNPNKKKVLEVYLFDENINLYRKEIEVVICKKIRNEKCFKSIEDLKHQIIQDVKIVKKYFKDKHKNKKRQNNERL